MCRRVTSDSLVQSEPSKVTMVLYLSTECLYASRLAPRCFKCQRFGHSKTNFRGTLTCARCAVAGHESTGCNAVEKCVNCQGQHTSFSRSCPKWKQEKEVVATKYQNNISFPEARRLVKEQAPPDGRSYASVVEKDHPVYKTTNCPHCNHIVTKSNFPSTSKSPQPFAITSSSGTKNKNMLPKSSSPTSEFLRDSQDSSGFTIVNRKKKPKTASKNLPANNNKIKANTATKFWKKSPQTSATEKDKYKLLKNKTDKNKISTAETANSNSESSEENSSDTDSD
ncbi:hypothetical protein AVEN_113663-1 [Araneus ventricosus]|uniref:CCHC-type domain-containing protein n=1 Tax=Araneus ventricosus TaxID=182803 RepID=A0A4Y2NRH8_ARAVE|nr:hypothetical protein AVEN_113663-1 [Araneus ventricosus]